MKTCLPGRSDAVLAKEIRKLQNKNDAGWARAGRGGKRFPFRASSLLALPVPPSLHASLLFPLLCAVTFGRLSID